MPSTQLFGCLLRQLATDNALFYFMVAVVQVVWLFIYFIGIAAFAHPQTCAPGIRSSPQQWAITFACLALFIAQAAATVAATLLTLRGTPLEPESKRRWVGRLSYAYLASLPVNAGMLAWACWVVRAGDGTCWSSGDRAMPSSIFFGGIGVLLGQAVGVAVSYNQLGDVRHGKSWHSVTRTGFSSLLHLCSSFGAKHRGPGTTLEELVTDLQHLMAGIAADKTDVVAGLACAALLQDEAAAAAAGAGQAADDSAAASAGGREEEQSTKTGQDSMKTGGSTAAAALAGTSCASINGSVAASVTSAAAPKLLAWAEGVCLDAAAALPAKPGGSTASGGELLEAAHWAQFAAAAYGARQHFWRRGGQSSWAAGRALSAAVAEAAAQEAQPLAGWGCGAPGSAAGKRRPSRAELKDFAAAWQLLGDTGGQQVQIVHFCSGSEPGGLLPHLLAVDSKERAVVLGIAGNWLRPHALPQVQAEALPGWLLGPMDEAGLRAGGPAGSWVHRDSLEAAEAVAAELERGQLLQRLLRPGSAAGVACREGRPGLQGLDCTGWRLVLSGHGQGAGAAALLAIRLQAWQLGPVAVWAHGPPAQLCSPDVAARLAAACSLTRVVVGDDAVPRVTSTALGRLVEQAVVGLARLRYCKFGLLAALAAERLGPARWQGRWYRHGRALRPLGELPAEALAWLQRFRDWQQQQQQGQAGEFSGSLPGRVLWLSRLPAPEPGSTDGGTAGTVAGQPAAAAGGPHSDSSGWQAAWVDAGEAAGWGIRVSRHVLSDHYVSRLLGVLCELAG